MEVTLLRHGESEYNQLGILQGRIDCRLSENGITQTIKKAKEFNSSLYDICFSSPLTRTLQTAKILVPNLPIICDERIIERDLGDWQGTSITDEKLFLLNILHSTPPNGESTIEISKRAKNFIDFLNEKYEDKRVLVITHAGIIYAIQVALGLDVNPIENLETLTIKLGGKELIKEKKI